VPSWEAAPGLKAQRTSKSGRDGFTSFGDTRGLFGKRWIIDREYYSQAPFGVIIIRKVLGRLLQLNRTEQRHPILQRRSLTSVVRIRNREAACQKIFAGDDVGRRAKRLSQPAKAQRGVGLNAFKIGLSVYLKRKFCCGDIPIVARPAAGGRPKCFCNMQLSGDRLTKRWHGHCSQRAFVTRLKATPIVACQAARLLRRSASSSAVCNETKG
jgi:hypothetical protein